ncbi:MAG: flagellar hook-basal body complex protein FliE [Geminicoccaceae bacterium]|nr:flagellar hook-basal body complex protein FliE [Geminicoccaceae bacterium]
MNKLAPAEALAVYRSAVARLEQNKAAAGATAPAAGSFQALLASELEAGVGALRTGEKTALDGLTGKAGVQQVVEALTAAELSLQRVTAVRDRVISAYQEIIRMPI